MTHFTLHHQLAADTILAGDLSLCRVLLMNNRHFPWLVLESARRRVARKLTVKINCSHQTVMEEVPCRSRFAALTGAYKMNIAALGNMVPQLHIHIIARHENDSAWPQPVWSANIKAEQYQSAAASFINNIKQSLAIA